MGIESKYQKRLITILRVMSVSECQDQHVNIFLSLQDPHWK